MSAGRAEQSEEEEEEEEGDVRPEGLQSHVLLPSHNISNNKTVLHLMQRRMILQQHAVLHVIKAAVCRYDVQQ